LIKLILGGKETEGASSIEVKNPFDGSVIDRAAAADATQVEQAISRAEQARDQVARLTRAQRHRVLSKVSEEILKRGDQLATLLASEVGKTVREARGEVGRAASTFALAAEEAHRLAGEVIPFDAVPQGVGRRGFSLKVPLGTVLAITPFNFPLNLAAHKVAPAMAAGNPFILKPASVTPLTDLELGRIVLEAGFPPEAVSVLPGSGQAIGKALVGDPRPRMVTFTGSVEVGRRIAAQAGFKRIAMELGSNSAVVVTSSADLEFAMRRITLGAFALAGQVCISVQRVIAQESVYEEVVDSAGKMARQLKIGDQLEESTDMGPMISEDDAVRAREWIEEAVSGGARLVTGGKGEGTLFEPTVLADVPTEARVWKEEAFAPVVCVNRYSDFDQAVAMVNDSRYGLQGGIFTDSLEETFKAAEEFEVGGVVINDVPTFRVDQMPYGGVKDSGLGREGLKYAIEEMTEEKLVCFNFWRP
jgi:glyceraldehyde-3-phosphate dehydrogenase (NADP+)